jgi:hypothetical protein
MGLLYFNQHSHHVWGHHPVVIWTRPELIKNQRGFTNGIEWVRNKTEVISNQQYEFAIPTNMGDSWIDNGICSQHGDIM